MQRGAVPSGPSIPRLASLVAIAGLLAGCGTSVPNATFAPPSGGVATTPTAAASRGTGPAAPTSNAAPTGTASGGPFDPAAIAVHLETVATVPGGPLAISAVPDGSGRTLVAAKDGRIWILRAGTVAATPMLDLRALVSTGSEQGLLGIAVHPRFPADDRVFVDYTDVRGNTVVAAYRIAAGSPDRLDPASATRILGVAQPFPNHNGGGLAFGPDGMLYVTLGDGGSGGDPLGNGQRLDTLLGKILRLDVDVPAGSPKPYSVPPGNPFVGRAGARPEIWLYGLRNPWRVSFDAATGDLWIGDVGQNKWEEIDVARSGASGLNFGWNRTEGRHCYDPPSGCSTAGITMPVTEYGHGLGCAVIGGVVARGPAEPLLDGGYLFSDDCSGRIWAIPASADGPIDPTQVGQTGAGVAGFGVDAAGEVLVANLDGTISRVVATAR